MNFEKKEKKLHHTNIRTYALTNALTAYPRPQHTHAEGFFRSFPYLRKASSEEAFRIFGRSLPICGEAAPQTQVRKNVPKGGVIFLVVLTYYT